MSATITEIPLVLCDQCDQLAEVQHRAYPLENEAGEARCYEHRLFDGRLRGRTYLSANFGRPWNQAMFTTDLIPPPADMVAVGLKWGGNPIETRIPLVEATPARVACEAQSLRKHALWQHPEHLGQPVGRECISVAVRTSTCGYGSFAPGSRYTPGRPAYVPKAGVLISIGEDALRMWGAVRRHHDLNGQPLPVAV